MDIMRLAIQLHFHLFYILKIKFYLLSSLCDVFLGSLNEDTSWPLLALRNVTGIDEVYVY